MPSLYCWIGRRECEKNCECEHCLFAERGSCCLKVEPIEAAICFRCAHGHDCFEEWDEAIDIKEED